MLTYGWQGVARLWALLLLGTAAVFWLGSTEDPKQAARRAPGQPAAPLARQVEPLRRLQIWRFGLYYFFVFGGYVALSVWLPRYLMAVHGLDIRMAAVIAIAFSLPAGLLRVVGGMLSDRYGARRVMYWSFIGWLVCTFMLSYPPTDYAVHGRSGELRFTIATGLPVFILMLMAQGSSWRSARPPSSSTYPCTTRIRLASWAVPWERLEGWAVSSCHWLSAS